MANIVAPSASPDGARLRISALQSPRLKVAGASVVVALVTFAGAAQALAQGCSAG